MRGNFFEMVGPQDSEWMGIANITKLTKTASPRVLLVDDDSLFCRTMAQVAKRYRARITTCASLNSFLSLADKKHFDIAILDYYLGNHIAPEVMQLLPPQTQVLLISASQVQKDQPWPHTIKAFVDKSLGPTAIFQAAVSTTVAAEKVLTQEKMLSRALVALFMAALFFGLLQLFEINVSTTNHANFRWDAAPIPLGQKLSEATLQLTESS